MKKLVLLLLSLSIPIISTAQVQKTAVDARIVEVYADQLEKLVLTDPQNLKDLNDILNKRYEIIELKYEMDEKYLNLSNIPLFNKYNSNLTRDTYPFDTNTFNILKYDLNFFEPYDMVYRIYQTNYAIVIHPQFKPKYN